MPNSWEEAHKLNKNLVIAATRELFQIAESHPGLSIEQFGVVYESIVDKYGEAAAVVALQAIENSRQAAGQWDVLPEPRLAPPAPAEQVRATFAWAVGKARRGDLLFVAQMLAGPLGRLVQQRARHTVYDATAVAGTRYARLPGPKACAFCLMLASRGAVYTKQTALTVGLDQEGRKRSKRPEGLKFHDNCDCIAIESYSPADLPQVIQDLEEEWAKATSRKDGQPGDDQWALWQQHVRETRPNGETVPVAKLRKTAEGKPKTIKPSHQVVDAQTYRAHDIDARTKLSEAEVRKAYARAEQAAKRIHGGEIPMKPIVMEVMRRDRFGLPPGKSAIRATSHMVQRKMVINPTKKATELTVLHEFGHFIDRDALIPERQRKMAILKAIESTQAVSKIETFKPMDRDDVLRKDYLLNSEELFARAYAQWAAMRSGDKRLIESLRKIRSSQKEAGLLPEQWEDEEFNEIIAPAMDEYFNKWLESRA